jgi:hypothetical protein
MKNMYKKITFVWGCIGMIYLGISCTGNFDQINENPNSVPYDMMLRDNLLTGSAIAQMENYCITTDANQYQRMFNLAGDIFSGYLGATENWAYNNTYNLYDAWYNVAFEVAYGKIMAGWRVLDLSKDEDPESFALAQILKVFGMHKITDMYGPIPYSQFGKSEKVSYDAQEDIYALFLTELTDAVDILYEYVQLYPDARPLKNYDAIYNGDYSKWVKFANLLKLRLAMRIYYADAAKSQQYAEEAANHPGGLLETNADNAFYPTPQRNPLNEIWNDYNDTRMGATIACYMKGYSDPRIAAYFTPQARNSVTDYRGVRNGISLTNAGRLTNYVNQCGLPTVAYSDPIQWMVAAESYFLKAEGAIRGWNMGGTAEDLYNLGIQTSFDQTGVSGAAAYLDNSTAKPMDFTDEIVSTNSYSYNPANELTIKWDDSATDEVKQERIITQKYLAIYPDGQEAWSEFRRTRYPKVIPNVINNSGTIINTIIQIRRLKFPTTEYANNAEEVQKAVVLLGGADNGGTNLWWDKK